MRDKVENTDTYYKYLPIDRIKYLDDKLLRFTQPGDLNDPFECYPKQIEEEKIYDKVKERLSKNKKGLSISEEHLRKIIRETNENFLPNTYNKINQEIGILSFSTIWKSSLMWSHYCESHTGFCIGFNKTHEFFKDFSNNKANESQHTKKVKYQPRRPEIDDDEINNFEILFTKSCEWDYEYEVRVIKTLNLKHSKIPNEKGRFKIYLFEVPHDAISEIIIGVRTPPEAKERIVKFCNEKNIKVYQSETSEITYDMERSEI